MCGFRLYTGTVPYGLGQSTQHIIKIYKGKAYLVVMRRQFVFGTQRWPVLDVMQYVPFTFTAPGNWPSAGLVSMRRTG